MSNGEAMKTRFEFTTIPGMTHYQEASREGLLRYGRDMTPEAARAAAQKDPAVAYYCQTDSSTFAFYTGRDFWLGSNADHSTTVVSELYDTSDADTKSTITASVRASLWIDGFDTRKGTAQQPSVVHLGIVVVGFSDLPAGDAAQVASMTTGLLGPPVPIDTGVESTVAAFVRRESHGRVTLEVDGTTRTVTLARPHTDFQRVDDPTTVMDETRFDTAALLAAVDAVFEFPDTWDVVLFAFPPVVSPPAGGSTPPGTRNTLSFVSNCQGARTVDGAQTLQALLMAPADHGDPYGTHTITVHEVMHALGLPDLYSNESYRSFGWSIMSDRKAGEHITGFEKLALGWDDLDDYWVLKRGLLPVDDMVSQAQAAGKKGVLVLPDPKALRVEFYAIERPQPIGIETGARASRAAAQSADPGLLVLMVRPDRAEGRMVPFVAARPTVPGDADRYGGASAAAYGAGADFRTNGIQGRATPGYLTDAGRKIWRVIGVDATFEPPHRASTLRENEMVWKNSVGTFELTTSGVLYLAGGPAIPLTAPLQSRASVRGKDYGFCASLDEAAAFSVVAALDGRSGGDRVQFPRPAGVPAPATGTYELVVENNGSTFKGAALAVYRKGSGTGTKLYDLFRRASYVRGDTIVSAPLAVRLEPDGNLVVRTTAGTFVAGTYQQHGNQYLSAVDIDGSGVLRLLDEYGAARTTIPATGRGTGPFTLALTDGATSVAGAVVVRDRAKAVVNTLLSWTATTPG